MAIVIFTMLVILVVAVGVVAVVVMGIEGTGREQHPELADAFAKTARHLSGEAEPPAGLKSLAKEFDEVGVPTFKEIPARVRSLRSAASASSASSASVPESPSSPPSPTFAKSPTFAESPSVPESPTFAEPPTSPEFPIAPEALSATDTVLLPATDTELLPAADTELLPEVPAEEYWTAVADQDYLAEVMREVSAPGPDFETPESTMWSAPPEQQDVQQDTQLDTGPRQMPDLDKLVAELWAELSYDDDPEEGDAEASDSEGTENR